MKTKADKNVCPTKQTMKGKRHKAEGKRGEEGIACIRW